LPNENDPDLSYSELEAQRTSGLNRRTLRRLMRNGQLRATKIGRVTRIDKHSLAKYMHDHGYAEQLRLFD
jgi:excisionase family DNA binding protein